MEVRLRPHGRMSLGTARRYLRIPGAAIALGERIDPGCIETLAADFEVGPAVAREARSLLPFDSQYFLSADDRCNRVDAAGHDRAILHGLAGDAADRFAAGHRIVHVDLRVLHTGAEGAVSRLLEACLPVCARTYGGRGGAHGHQYSFRAGSADRLPDRVRAYAQVRD